MAKVVHGSGMSDTYFLGLAECPERRSKGLLKAVQNACFKTIGEEGFRDVLLKTSSFVTDGTNCNTGEKEGLWTKIKKLRNEMAGMVTLCQLITIWCGVHRSNLAWESVTNSVKEVNHLFQELVWICSYFRRSGVRSRELRDIAAKNNFRIMKLPKLFEIRWSQFTYQLLNNILVSWKAPVTYFENFEDPESFGFLLCLTRYTI